jgi:hypothetical protein
VDFAVEDVDAWHRQLSQSGLAQRLGVWMKYLVDQP